MQGYRIKKSRRHGRGRVDGVAWFNFERDDNLLKAVTGLPVQEMMRFAWEGIPLGALCLPGLRWILRIHHLQDDESTRYLLREYILSAWNIAKKFEELLDQMQPRAVVVFNGQFFPEATARYLAQKRGIRVITHEVGLQPASAYFTEGEATAYPITIPELFEMNVDQDARLDAYLEERFQGNFTMAGIKFWPAMQGLDPAFLVKAARVPTDRARVYERDLRYEPAARQYRLRGYVRLAGPCAGCDPFAPGDVVRNPRPSR